MPRWKKRRVFAAPFAPQESRAENDEAPRRALRDDRPAEAGAALVTPCWVCTEPEPGGPAGMVLVYEFSRIEVTFTRITQLEFCAIVPPFKEINASPAARAGPPSVEVNVPVPQPVRVALNGVATTIPTGRVSVNVVLVKGVTKSLLRMVMVSWLVSPTKIVFGAKILLTEGG